MCYGPTIRREREGRVRKGGSGTKFHLYKQVKKQIFLKDVQQYLSRLRNDVMINNHFTILSTVLTPIQEWMYITMSGHPCKTNSSLFSPLYLLQFKNESISPCRVIHVRQILHISIHCTYSNSRERRSRAKWKRLKLTYTRCPLAGAVNVKKNYERPCRRALRLKYILGSN